MERLLSARLLFLPGPDRTLPASTPAVVPAPSLAPGRDEDGRSYVLEEGPTLGELVEGRYPLDGRWYSARIVKSNSSRIEIAWEGYPLLYGTIFPPEDAPMFLRPHLGRITLEATMRHPDFNGTMMGPHPWWLN